MPSDPAPPHLLGRDAELAALIARLDAIHGGGGALVIHGEAGIGKSTLLRMAAYHAKGRGFEILRTTAVESEASLPFAALHQVLLPLLGLAGHLPPASRDALRSAFGSGDGSASVFQVAVATLQLLGERDDSTPVLV